MGRVVDEGNKVSVPSMRGDGEWSAYVSVHVAEYVFGTC